MSQIDVFPALVVVGAQDSPLPVTEMSSTSTRGDGYYQINSARVIVTNDQVLIAQDGPVGPVIVFNERVLPGSFVKGARNEDSYVVTSQGRKLAFSKDSSCGCGSRLKGWNPFKYAMSVKDP